MTIAAKPLDYPARQALSFAPVAIVTLLAVVYALTIIDVPFILGTGPIWDGVWGDRFTNLIGALYYAHDAWRFPLFFVPKLGFPEGANIVYTDSIPVAALGLKVIYKLTGAWFNYFGLWVFLCFPLLGLFGALAAKEAGVKDNLGIIAAGVLAIACPAFLFRWMHLALMGHFLIVWSIYLYLRLRNAPAGLGTIFQFSIVSALTLLIQAYFLMMVVPFLVAALLQCLVEGRMRLSRAAMALGWVAGFVVLVGLVAGIIGPHTPKATAEGFGYLSMNVLSPVIPPRDHLPEFVARFIHWDPGGLTWDANTGQYEGYSYFGGGLLLLALINLVASPRLALGMIARNRFVALLLVGYFLVAISHNVFIGDWHVVDWPLPHYLQILASYFRAGGRFFWPAYYVLMIGLVALTYRRFDRGVARLVVIAATIVQLADTQPLRRNMGTPAAWTLAHTLPAQEWQPLLAAHRFFAQYPAFQCGGWADNWAAANENLELLWEAAKLDMPTNSVYLGRLNRDCVEERAKAVNFDIQPDGLYVFGGDFPIGVLEDLPSFKKLCREFSNGVVCSRKWDILRSAGGSSSFKPISHTWVPPYKLGETLTFSPGRTGSKFLAYGWLRPESWGVWSVGGKSELILGIPKDTADATLTVRAAPVLNQRRPAKEFSVIINGRPVATWTFMLGHLPATHSIALPKDLLLGASSLRIAFVPKVVETPEQIGISDPRPIGLMLMELTVSEAEQRN